MDGPIGVSRSNAADEVALECLDGVFGRIDLMVIWPTNCHLHFLVLRKVLRDAVA